MTTDRPSLWAPLEDLLERDLVSVQQSLGLPATA